MNTSPILAAASFPSPATANPGAAADSPDFHQVLQQLRPPAAPSNAAPSTAPTQMPMRPIPVSRSRRQPLPPARDVPASQALAAAPRDFPAATSSAIAVADRSSTAVSAQANLLAGLTANPQQPGATNVSPDAQIAQITEEDTADKNSIGANQNAKEAVVAGAPKTEKARPKSAVANPSAVPVAAPLTPAPEPSAFSSALLATAKTQPSTNPQLSDAAPLASADGFTLEPAAIVAPADVIRGRAATATAAIGHTTDEISAAASAGRPAASSATAPALMPEPTTSTASSAAVASPSDAPSAKPKAKPQPAISPGKADSSSVTNPADDATADRSTPSARAAAQENIVAGSSFANPSVLRSNAQLAFGQAPRSARTGPQMAPLSSSATAEAQPNSKSNGVSPSSDRDPSLSAASALSAHPSGFQSAAGQPTWVAAAIIPDATSGAQVAAQSTAAQSAAAQSAAFAQPSPNSAPASTPPQAPVPAAALPHPPPVVDSGQLRVTANNSELKISVQLPELGKVEVRAVTAHDVTTAHLTAFRHDALPVLAAERTGLEQALKSRDVILGSLNAHAQNSQAQGQSPGQQRQQASPSCSLL